MSDSERQSRIREYLTRYNEMEIGKLSELLKVSPSTIRREIRGMEASGFLVRTHGGVRMHAPLQYEPPYEKRASSNVDGKRAIAAAARQMISPGQVIGISGGTTCTELARQLRFVKGITVVTNAINVALELYGQSSIRVMVTGGFLNHNSYELVGNQTSESLQPVHMDMAFLGASGIDPDFGLSMSDEPEVLVGHAFMAAADRTVVLADSSKIGRKTFARLAPLSEIDLVITDDGITAEQRALIERTNLKMLVGASEQ